MEEHFQKQYTPCENGMRTGYYAPLIPDICMRRRGFSIPANTSEPCEVTPPPLPPRSVSMWLASG